MLSKLAYLMLCRSIQLLVLLARGDACGVRKRVHAARRYSCRRPPSRSRRWTRGGGWPVGARKSVVALSCEFVEKPPGRAMIAA
jgi:hypothetical protein